MKFYNAKCLACQREFFHEDEVVAFAIRVLTTPGVLEPILLAGRQPWSGIRTICRSCVEALHGYALAPHGYVLAPPPPASGTAPGP